MTAVPTRKATLITHPVRARILTALMGRQLTTQQIADALPDVPLPSVYRHVRILAEAGILTPADEVRVNGAPVKVYTVREGGGLLEPTDLADATQSDQLRYFSTFLTTLSENFRTYLERESEGFKAEMVFCRSEPLSLSPNEFKEFYDGLEAFLKPFRERTPTPERRRLLFATIGIPDKPDPPAS
jgi:DNA-binding transcriptional ArsR family regulator